MHHTITLDVHKRETQACIADAKGNILSEKRFRTTEKAYRRNLKKYSDADVVLESVGFYRPVAKWLTDLGADVHLAHLGKIPKPKLKTDKKDARHLLRLYQGNALPEAYLAPDEVQRLRDLARHRRLLGQESRRLKGTLKQNLYKHGHFVDDNPILTQKGRAWLQTLPHPEIRSLFRLWEHVRDEIKEAQRLIEAETTNHPDALRLMTIPGVGAYTALLILAEVGSFDRFPDGAALASYAGLVPSQHQSGDTDRHGSITKQGNANLRWALVEATRNHVRDCPESTFSRRHARLAETKGYQKATVAAARQLCTVLHVMMTREEEFKVNP
jgi:transposase